MKPDMLAGDNLIAWRSDLGLSAPPSSAAHRIDLSMPPTLVVLNPGDRCGRASATQCSPYLLWSLLPAPS